MTANPYAAPTDPLAPYDAVLVASFGGPRSPEEVMPFLRRVSSGRIPDERLAEVARHYDRFGGVSPINDATDAFVNAIGSELRRHGYEFRCCWETATALPSLRKCCPKCTRTGYVGCWRLSPLPMPATPGAASTAKRLRLS